MRENTVQQLEEAVDAIDRDQNQPLNARSTADLEREGRLLNFCVSVSLPLFHVGFYGALNTVWLSESQKIHHRNSSKGQL